MLDPEPGRNQNGASETPETDETRTMIAHDIRGALSGVKGGIAALNAMGLPEEAMQQVARIDAAAGSVDMLTMFAIGCYEPSLINVGNDEVDLSSLLNHTRRRIEGEALSKGLDVNIVEGPGLPRGIKIPDMHIGRMVSNLVINAVRHTESGSVSVEFSRSGEGSLIISITDTGAGIPQKVLDDFACERSGSVAARAGTRNLGLHIVQKLAGESNCIFTISRGQSGGTIAEISVPASLCVEYPAGTAPRKVIEKSKPNLPDLSGVRILLAEDNPTNQMVARQMLNTMNADVLIVSDGVEALEEFEKAEFDLVVVDIEMPRLSGLGVIRTIRARPDNRAQIPIVALTAYALREHRDRIDEAGANGLISKPIAGIEELGRELVTHISKEPEPVAAAEPAVVSAPEATDNEGPVVDMITYDALREAIGPDVMAELLDKVHTDLNTARIELQSALMPLNTEPIRASSHILISVAGAIGASRLEQCARELNVAAHDVNISSLATRVQSCISEIDDALAFVRDEQSPGS